MTRYNFDRLFIEAKHKLLPQSKNEVIFTFRQYVKNINNIQLDMVFTYVQMESMKYTENLMYAVLSEIVVDKQQNSDSGIDRELRR